MQELADIEAHITQGVSLPLVSSPSAVEYSNTPAVLQHANAVRTRLREYMDFGAVVKLPIDANCTDDSLRIQPLHVIIKAGKKPRLVIDLSRNLNDHLEYEYFNYSSVDDAVEASHPGCWYGKLDLSNCFLSFPSTSLSAEVLLLSLRGRAVSVHSHAVRPQHSTSCLHTAAVGRQLRSRRSSVSATSATSTTSS